MSALTGVLMAYAGLFYGFVALTFAFVHGEADAHKRADSEATEIMLFALLWPVTAAYVWGRTRTERLQRKANKAESGEES